MCQKGDRRRGSRGTEGGSVEGQKVGQKGDRRWGSKKVGWGQKGEVGQTLHFIFPN